MNSNTFKIAQSLLFASMLITLAACKQKSEVTKQEGINSPATSVRIQKIEIQSVPLTEEVVGTVTARVRATLEAKLVGRIETMSSALGDKVRAGEIIARLDSAETAARLEQAEASLEQAERDWKRVVALYDQQSATRSERDASEARLRQTRGAVAEARAMLAHAQVVAPFDGVVSRKWADAGDLATPGKPLVDIEDPGSLQVEVDVPEGLAGRLTSSSEFTIVDNCGAKIKGALQELSPASDPLTRTRKAKLKLLEVAQLASGQFVRVSIPLGERKALFVPREALLERGQLEIAFTIENQHARMHLVKTGSRSEGRVEILSGLHAGETLVIQGAEGLTDGQPLEVK